MNIAYFEVRGALFVSLVQSRNMFALFFLGVFVQCCVGQIAIGGGGLDDPDLYHQRYRGDEELFKNKDFFQWWFFWVKARKNDGSFRHFTIHYATSRVSSPEENNGGFIGFSFVGWKKSLLLLFASLFSSLIFSSLKTDESSNTHGYRADRFERLNTTRAMDPLYFSVSLGSSCSLTPVDNNTYHLIGSMSQSDELFYSSPVLKNSTLSWNVVVSRKTGWYGEAGLVDLLADTLGRGMISWNPYAHSSIASGTISMNNETWTVDAADAYGDMNWGKIFPHWNSGSDWPQKEYAWGWYSMRLPGANIIVGLG